MSNTIGRVRGAKDNSYTLGVICEKVARYSERIHHPERLLLSAEAAWAPRARGTFARITWDEAMDEIASRFLAIEAEARQRGDLALLVCGHHGLRHARWHRPPDPRQELLPHVRQFLRVA